MSCSDHNACNYPPYVSVFPGAAAAVDGHCETVPQVPYRHTGVGTASSQPCNTGTLHQSGVEISTSPLVRD